MIPLYYTSGQRRPLTPWWRRPFAKWIAFFSLLFLFFQAGSLFSLQVSDWRGLSIHFFLFCHFSRYFFHSSSRLFPFLTFLPFPRTHTPPPHANTFSAYIYYITQKCSCRHSSDARTPQSHARPAHTHEDNPLHLVEAFAETQDRRMPRHGHNNVENAGLVNHNGAGSVGAKGSPVVMLKGDIENFQSLNGKSVQNEEALFTRILRGVAPANVCVMMLRRKGYLGDRDNDKDGWREIDRERNSGIYIYI